MIGYILLWPELVNYIYYVSKKSKEQASLVRVISGSFSSREHESTSLNPTIFVINWKKSKQVH
jgi:hypothetical protein